MDGLRRETDVTHHRDLRRDDALDGFLDGAAPLELHGVGTPVLHTAHGTAQGLLGRDLVAPEGHVGDHQCPAGAARDQARVIDDLVEGHGKRRVPTLHDVSERVPHQQDVDTGGVEDAGEGVVVGREHRDLLAAAFAPRDHGQRDAMLSAGLGSDGRHGRLHDPCVSSARKQKRACR
jgi:hypothetical protein